MKRENETNLCVWTFTGKGFEYDLLAGPIFIVCYTVAGIFVGFTADIYNRYFVVHLPKTSQRAQRTVFRCSAVASNHNFAQTFQESSHGIVRDPVVCGDYSDGIRTEVLAACLAEISPWCIVSRTVVIHDALEIASDIFLHTSLLNVFSEAGCTPFAASIIADYFSENARATALGIYNWGVYVGYSMSYAVGNFITDANILGQVKNLFCGGTGT